MPNLQILRFAAAALVLISHVQHEALKSNFLDLHNYSPWEFLYFAGGVDIFFVISGFIMYAIASKDFGGHGQALKFMLRRLVRIVPPYWLFTTAMIVAAWVFSDHVTHAALDVKHIAASYFFYPYANAYGRAYPMLMLGWTLNYEFFFYVVFAAGLCFHRKLGLALIFATIGALGILGGLGLLPQLPFQFWGNPIIFEFLFGIMLAMARERNVRLSAPLCWLSIAVGVALMLSMTRLGISGNFWNWRFLWMGVPAVCICAAVVLAREKNLAPSRLRACAVLLGDASYAIYLSHPFSLNAVALLCGRYALSNAWLYVFIASMVSLAVGVAVHLWLERPLTAWLNGRLDLRFGHCWSRGGVTGPAV